jgi:hypothetical protein
LEAAGATETDPGLSGELLRLLRSPETEAQLKPPGWFERGAHVVLLRRFMPDRLERFLIRLGLLLNVLTALLWLLIVLVVASGFEPSEVTEPSGPVEFPQEPLWLALLGIVWIVTGVASAVALGMSLLRQHERAMGLARYTLLVALVAGGLLETYVSQLGALTNMLIQLALLVLVLDQLSRLGAARAG